MDAIMRISLLGEKVKKIFDMETIYAFIRVIRMV